MARRPRLRAQRRALRRRVECSSPGRRSASDRRREHAVWAIQQYGFDAVIAPSFSDIFRNNCTKNGLVPVVLPEPTVERIWAAIEADPADRDRRRRRATRRRGAGGRARRAVPDGPDDPAAVPRRPRRHRHHARPRRRRSPTSRRTAPSGSPPDTAPPGPPSFWVAIPCGCRKECPTRTGSGGRLRGQILASASKRVRSRRFGSLLNTSTGGLSAAGAARAAGCASGCAGCTRRT